MKTKQIVLHSAVTIVATGLTLLSSGTSEASGRGPSGMRISGSHGGMHNGAIHQGISNRALSHGRAAVSVMSRNQIDNRGSRSQNATRTTGRDDRGGHGERERRHGKDDGIGHDASVTRGERERERRHGKDDGIGHDLRDNNGGRGERERRHGEREMGDDHGRL